MLLNKLCQPLDIKIRNLIRGLGKLYGKTLLLCSPVQGCIPFTQSFKHLFCFFKMVKKNRCINMFRYNLILHKDPVFIELMTHMIAFMA